jgi:hypothetical protein
MINLLLSVLLVTTPPNLPVNTNSPIPVYVTSSAENQFNLGKFLEANWFILATLIAALSQLHMSVREIKQEFKYIKNKLEETQETTKNFVSKEDLENIVRKQRFVLYTIDKLIDFINDKPKLSKEEFLIKHDFDDYQN